MRDLPVIEIVQVMQALYMNPPRGLDAIFMTLPAAERWSPDFRSRHPQIIVTGVNLGPEDPKDPVSQVRIVLESVLKAVKSYNDQGSSGIKNLGFWTMDLTRGITTEQLSELLHDFVSDNGPQG